ncbi:MAG: Na/Pi cotransporter family protein [Desulfobacterales bacterium]|nr:Na/Pi cotransporter family protein [Desulfobacterales bacterium]MCP4158628.1 Na/Pi cotransporter family protein [Deltaproteobacteria bacterium]
MMVRKFIFLPVFLLLGYSITFSNDFATIATGIAIFMVGMIFMEDGFKMFTGGALEKILKKTTNTLPKSIFSGFIATAIVQSSSLISVITISFLSAELLALSNGIGIVFGANIGTTATAWIVSAFGLKIKISNYAMPMIIFGVLFLFFKKNTTKGFGNILLGLGFIFLGISYMKDGFENLKSGIDLARFAMDGYLGVAIYVIIGAAMTIIIQSSSATIALIITAVASGQVEYINSLSLAIGANVGTTVTAILGSLASNANGKRLAVAHFIFKTLMAFFAIVFIYLLKDLVDFASNFVGIAEHDIAMKLSLFHTIINILGVALIIPFTARLVKFLETLFIFKGERRGRPRYLDLEVIKIPLAALIAIHKETEHLYDSVSHLMVQSLRLHRHEVWSDEEMKTVVRTFKNEAIDVDQVYIERIKSLYSEILDFIVQAEKYMNKEYRSVGYKYKITCRSIVEMVKEIRELQKNIAIYMNSENKYIKKEYNLIRRNIADIIRNNDFLRKNPGDQSAISNLESARTKVKKFEKLEMRRLSILLRKEMINNTMATSLMNDSVFTGIISENLVDSATTLWLEDPMKRFDDKSISDSFKEFVKS